MDESIMCNCSKGEEKLAIPGDRVDESGTYVISRVIYCIDYSSGDGTVELFYFLIIKGSSLNLNNSMSIRFIYDHHFWYKKFDKENY